MRKTQQDRKCGVRFCTTPVGEERRFCSVHTWDAPEHVRRYLRGKTLVMGYRRNANNEPSVVLGVFRGSQEAFDFRDVVKGGGEFEVVFTLNDTNALSDPVHKDAIRQWLEAKEEGAVDMATATKRAKRGTKSEPRSKVARKCECGCGGMTSGGRFLPGHDAKLKSRLIEAIRSGRKNSDGATVKKGEAKMRELGWAHFIPSAQADAERAKKNAERVAKLRKANAKSKAKPKAKAAKRSARKRTARRTKATA